MLQRRRCCSTVISRLAASGIYFSTAGASGYAQGVFGDENAKNYYSGTNNTYKAKNNNDPSPPPLHDVAKDTMFELAKKQIGTVDGVTPELKGLASGALGGAAILATGAADYNEGVKQQGQDPAVAIGRAAFSGGTSLYVAGAFVACVATGGAGCIVEVAGAVVLTAGVHKLANYDFDVGVELLEKNAPAINRFVEELSDDGDVSEDARRRAIGYSDSVKRDQEEAAAAEAERRRQEEARAAEEEQRRIFNSTFGGIRQQTPTGCAVPFQIYAQKYISQGLPIPTRYDCPGG